MKKEYFKKDGNEMERIIFDNITIVERPIEKEITEQSKSEMEILSEKVDMIGKILFGGGLQ